MPLKCLPSPFPFLPGNHTHPLTLLKCHLLGPPLPAFQPQAKSSASFSELICWYVCVLHQKAELVEGADYVLFTFIPQVLSECLTFKKHSRMVSLKIPYGPYAPSTTLLIAGDLGSCPPRNTAQLPQLPDPSWPPPAPILSLGLKIWNAYPFCAYPNLIPPCSGLTAIPHPALMGQDLCIIWSSSHSFDFSLAALETL